jgi:phosphoribosyl 1,2-cyclic phosphodiesterase
VDILGCRGSTPAVGPAFARYGGDTSSIAVSRDGEPPELVLDAGTGLRRLKDHVTPFRGTILLTHLHWDHTHGLPFASAVDHDDASVRLLVPGLDGDPVDVLSRALGPPHFPITPDQLRGDWEFGWIEEGRAEIEGFLVSAREVNHKGGRTFGYRVEDGTSSLAYIPDHSFTSTDEDAILDLAHGVDLLLHDSQDLASEWPGAAPLGHSTVEQTIDISATTGAGRTALFHHSPTRTDDEIDRIVVTIETSTITAAADRDTFHI